MTERDPVRAALADEITDEMIRAGRAAHHKHGCGAVREVFAAMSALRARLPGRLDCGGALKSLSNEISGWLSAYEPDLRAAMGNTNFAVMEHKLAEANVALLKTDVEYRRGYAAGVADQIETQEYERNIAEARPPTLNNGAVERACKLMADELAAGCSHHTLRKTWNEVEAALALPRAVDGGAAGEREAAIHDALLGLIEAVELDSDEGGKGISGYTAARLHDAREALSALPSTESGAG